MKIAMAQINPTTGGLEGNVNKIIKEIELSKGDSVDLTIFPEMALTGYCISDLIEDHEFVEKNREMLFEIAKHTKGTAAIVGFIDYDKNKKNNDGRVRKYNAAALLQDGKLIGVTHKSLLPNYRYFDDKRYFTSAEKRIPLEMTVGGKKLKIGISICEDMWDDDYEIKPVKELSDKGADLIVNINASPFVPGKFERRDERIKKHISYNHKPFIYLNTVGAADNGKDIIPFDGQSLAYDKEGNLIFRGSQFEEETIILDLDLDEIVTPFIPEKTEKEKEIYGALVMALRDYGLKCGFTKSIVPVSGGIDSALGLAITIDAFGKENVTAYNLPSKFNKEETKEVAEKLACNFGVEYKIIPIQKIDNTIREEFEKNNHKIQRGVSKENIHPRIRGLLMMLESNDSGALLVSNGNKTEIALGYATLYGDMCGGISVIGDLSKLEVYDLAEYVNQKYGREMIPKQVIDPTQIIPSAELSEDQYDPFDYYVTSPLVTEFSERRKSLGDLIRAFNEKSLDPYLFRRDMEGKTVYDKHTPESFEKLAYDTYGLIQRSVHKRVQGPPIIDISERAFGFDLRETNINKWRGR